MGHHRLSSVVETLDTIKIDHIYAIQILDNEKRYSDIIQQISKIYSKLNKAEQMMLKSLVQYNLLKIR
jgi:DNA-binding FrmR family transcriptional regulator